MSKYWSRVYVNFFESVENFNKDCQRAPLEVVSLSLAPGNTALFVSIFFGLELIILLKCIAEYYLDY